MKYITLLRSNLRKQKGGFIGIFFLMLIITVCSCGVLSIWFNSHEYVQNEMARTGFGDVVYWVANVPDIHEITDEIKEIWETDHVNAEKTVFVNGTLNGQDNSSSIQLNAYDPEHYPYHIFKGNSSEYETAPKALNSGEIYVPIAFRSIYDAEIGDFFYLEPDAFGNTESFVIKGFFEDPAQGTSMMGLKSILVNSRDLDRLYEAALLSSRTETKPQLVPAYRLHIFHSPDSSLSAKEFQQKINEETSTGKYVQHTYLKETIAGFMLLLQNIFVGFLVSFAAILLLVAIIVISHSISSSIEQDYVDLGILKALGYRICDLRIIQCLQYMLPCVAGLLLGRCLSPILVAVINRMILPITGIIAPDTLPLMLEIPFFTVILLLLLGFILLKTGKIGRITPILAIRGGRGDVFFTSRVHIRIYQKCLSFWLALRQLLSGKKQYIGACMITALLVFFLSLCGRVHSWMGPDGRGVMNAMGMASADGQTYDMAIHYTEDGLWEQVEKQITEYSPIAASYQTICQSAQLEHNNYLLNAISHPEYLHMVRGRYCKYDNEIVITDVVASELALDIGDTVTVSLGSNEAEYLITGINQCANDMGANFAISLSGYERIDDQSGQLYQNYVLKDNSRREALWDALEEEYGDRIIIEKNTWSGLDGLVQATGALECLMYGISMIFILIVVFMTGSKILYKEKHDLGIYKSLGFSSSRLRCAFALRFAVVSSAGSLLGMIISIFLTDPLVGKMFTLFGVSSFSSRLTTQDMLRPVVIVILIFFAFAYLAAGRIKKTDPGILIVE